MNITSFFTPTLVAMLVVCLLSSPYSGQAQEATPTDGPPTTATPTAELSPSATPTWTSTPTDTRTPTVTRTPTITRTPTLSPTITLSQTPTPTSRELYFVSQLGCDATGEGSLQLPYASIGKAAAFAEGVAGATVEIRVASGTYRENVVLRPYVHLLGGFDPITWAHSPASCPTTLDGRQAGSCIRAATVMLSDLTLTNGKADRGAGLYVPDNCSATITGCTVTRNAASDGGPSYTIIHTGGGLYLSGQAFITDCTLVNNTASIYGGEAWHCRAECIGHGGAAVYAYSGLSMANNYIADNTFTNIAWADYNPTCFGTYGFSTARGGAIYSSGFLLAKRNTILYTAS